jgi:hypothetical protein
MVTPLPNEVTSLSFEIRRSEDGRFEGRARRDGTDAWRPFSGVLELLKVMEELLTTAGPTGPTLDESKETGK